MNVWIATTDLDCPAAWALATEGVAYGATLNLDPFDYGSHFSDLWNEGKPFIVVEHDIVPWPGALKELWECDQPWCGYPFPQPDHNLANGFGVAKYRPRGSAPEEWPETEWRYLDGAVVPVLHERIGRIHLHGPPVAHARSPR